MGFMQALFDLDTDSPEEKDERVAAAAAKSPSKWTFWKQSRPGPQILPTSSPRASEQQGFSSQFAGVPVDALPSGLDDVADDIVQPAVLAESQAVDAMERMLAEPSPTNPEPTSLNLADRLKAIDKLQRRMGSVGGSPSGTPSRELSRAPSRAYSVLPGRIISREEPLGLTSQARNRSRQQSHGDRRRPSVVGPTGVRTPRTLEQQRLERRDRAHQLAEKLYNEMQSQL